MAVAAMDFSNRLPLTLLTFKLTYRDSEQTTIFHCSTSAENDEVHKLFEEEQETPATGKICTDD